MANFHAASYEKVAETIRGLRKYSSKGKITSAFAEMFMLDNPKFNVGMFWDACQPLTINEEGEK